jgi:hypothetical protein
MCKYGTLVGIPAYANSHAVLKDIPNGPQQVGPYYNNKETN